MVDPVQNQASAAVQTASGGDPTVDKARGDRFAGALAAAISRAPKPVYDSGSDGDDPDPPMIPASAPVLIPSTTSDAAKAAASPAPATGKTG